MANVPGLRFLGCLLLVSVLPAHSQVRRNDVDLTAPDGVHLKATYFAAARPGPAVLLFHMCGGAERSSWNNLATMLAAGGFHVLTLDYRGFGESGGPRFSGLDIRGQRAMRAKWPGDLDAALHYLLAQPGVDKARIGAGGTSCGANNSVDLAVRHPAVKSLVLISGGTNQAGLNYIRQADGLPILGMASDNDDEFVPYMRWLLAFSRNPQSRFVEYEKAGHGTDIFAVEKGAEPMIVDWFGKTLRGSAVVSGKSAAPVTTPNSAIEFWSVLTGPGGAARAAQLLTETKKRNPGAFLFPLYAVDALGREHLGNGDFSGAIEIFKLNVAAYPRSPIAYYSLAGAYIEAGNREQAIAHCEKTLEILEQDTALGSETRDFIRQNTEKNLRELRSSPGANSKPGSGK